MIKVRYNTGIVKIYPIDTIDWIDLIKDVHSNTITQLDYQDSDELDWEVVNIYDLMELCLELTSEFNGLLIYRLPGYVCVAIVNQELQSIKVVSDLVLTYELVESYD